MAIHLGGGDGSAYSAVSEINITPFVDVVLVLLIIFMVTAPQLQQGFEIDVPAVAAKTIEVTEDQVVVTVDKERRVWLDKFEVAPGTLAGELTKVFQNRAEKRLFVRADKDVPYGAVMEVLAAAREAGIAQIGMITAAPEGKAPPGPGEAIRSLPSASSAAAPAPAPAAEAKPEGEEGGSDLSKQLPLED